MIELPVIIGADVVKYGDWVKVLDYILLSQFRLRRVRHDPICQLTKQAISVARYPKDTKPADIVPDEGLGLPDRSPVCLLLETTKSYEQAMMSLSLLNDSRGVHSPRYKHGADHIVRDNLFLFLPSSQKHAELMRKSLF